MKAKGLQGFPDLTNNAKTKVKKPVDQTADTCKCLIF